MSGKPELPKGFLSNPPCEGGSFNKLAVKPALGSQATRLHAPRRDLVLRLTDFLAGDYEVLYLYLGKSRFNRMVRDYAAAHLSDSTTIRWHSLCLQTFLARWQTPNPRRELAELAAIEQALKGVLDSPKVELFSLKELNSLPLDLVGTMRFGLTAACTFLSLTTNAISIFCSIRIGETPPLAQSNLPNQHLLVWRQSKASRFRILGEEEMLALSCLDGSVQFSRIYELMAVYGNLEDASLRAVRYLRGWVGSELIVTTHSLDVIRHPVQD